MTTIPEPVWPVALLALVSLVDGLGCVKPAAFVAHCLEDVRFPRKLWGLLAPIKFAAAAGLVGGIWIPWLGLLTTSALVAYFLVAISSHIRARDIGRNFANANAMLLGCIAVLLWCFIF